MKLSNLSITSAITIANAILPHKTGTAESRILDAYMVEPATVEMLSKHQQAFHDSGSYENALIIAKKLIKAA